MHKDFQGQSVAVAIMKIRRAGTRINLKEITTTASITAKPFFARSGFVVIKEEQVDIYGVKLT